MSPVVGGERVVIELRRDEDGRRLWRCAHPDCSGTWRAVVAEDVPSAVTNEVFSHARADHGSGNVWFRAEAVTT